MMSLPAASAEHNADVTFLGNAVAQDHPCEAVVPPCRSALPVPAESPGRDAASAADRLSHPAPSIPALPSSVLRRAIAQFDPPTRAAHARDRSATARLTDWRWAPRSANGMRATAPEQRDAPASAAPRSDRRRIPLLW